MEAEVGIEPTNSGFANRCLTTWLLRLENCEFSQRETEITAGGRGIKVDVRPRQAKKPSYFSGVWIGEGEARCWCLRKGSCEFVAL